MSCRKKEENSNKTKLTNVFANTQLAIKRQSREKTLANIKMAFYFYFSFIYPGVRYVSGRRDITCSIAAAAVTVSGALYRRKVKYCNGRHANGRKPRENERSRGR